MQTQGQEWVRLNGWHYGEQFYYVDRHSGQYVGLVNPDDRFYFSEVDGDVETIVREFGVR